MFDDLAKKPGGDALVSDKDQVIDRRALVSAVRRNVFRQFGKIEVVSFDKANEVVGIEIAAVE